MDFELYRTKTGSTDDGNPNTVPPASEDVLGIYHRYSGSGRFRSKGFAIALKVQDAGGNVLSDPVTLTFWIKNNVDDYWYKLNDLILQSGTVEFYVPYVDGEFFVQLTNLPANAQTTYLYVKRL